MSFYGCYPGDIPAECHPSDVYPRDVPPGVSLDDISPWGHASQDMFCTQLE